MLAAVVVTYNRKDELCKNLTMLNRQTKKIDRVYIVDNCSTDGTRECLEEKRFLNQSNMIYLKTEANIGGAGGFYTGLHQAYADGADWVIMMDDDGRPCDEYTIQELFDYGEKLKKEKTADGKLFINSLVICGDRLTSKIGDMYTVSEAEAAAKDGVLVGAAHPFNGTMVSRALIEEIGYPNKEYFIKGDEVDYKQRSFDAGAFVVTVLASKYYHPYVPTEEKVLFGYKVPVCVEAPWKEYYTARNLTYTYKKKKHYKMIAFELIFVKLYAVFTMKCQKGKTIKYMFKGLRDGWNGRLGPTVKP